MSRLDRSIVELYINTWPDVPFIWKQKWPIYPAKDPSIKVEIDNLH